MPTLTNYAIFESYLFVEVAPSGQTWCHKCREKILKGQTRLHRKVPGYQFPSSEYWCRNCGITKLREEQEYFERLRDKLIKARDE